jgi:uncharacterized membrane protein YgaE (UPF0421/DUF939 family)
MIYLASCLAGVLICYGLYASFPSYPFYWAVVSVVLALSPDNNTKQAFSRIKANILGCTIGICLFPLHLPEIGILLLGVLIIIFLGLWLHITDTLRSSLAALVIVTMQVEQGKHWYIALERMVCVITGCVVALLLTILFNYLAREKA